MVGDYPGGGSESPVGLGSDVLLEEPEAYVGIAVVGEARRGEIDCRVTVWESQGRRHGLQDVVLVGNASVLLPPLTDVVGVLRPSCRVDCLRCGVLDRVGGEWSIWWKSAFPVQPSELGIVLGVAVQFKDGVVVHALCPRPGRAECQRGQED